MYPMSRGVNNMCRLGLLSLGNWGRGGGGRREKGERGKGKRVANGFFFSPRHGAIRRWSSTQSDRRGFMSPKISWFIMTLGKLSGLVGTGMQHLSTYLTRPASSMYCMYIQVCFAFPAFEIIWGRSRSVCRAAKIRTPKYHTTLHPRVVQHSVPYLP